MANGSGGGNTVVRAGRVMTTPGLQVTGMGSFFRFKLTGAHSADAPLRLYDISGRLVRTVNARNAGKSAGFVIYEWNGKNVANRGVGAGVYIARVAGVKTIKFVKY